MPPKGSKKAQAAKAAESVSGDDVPSSKEQTPENAPEESLEPPKPTPKRKATPRKAATAHVPVYHELNSVLGDAAPVTVSYENETVESKVSTTEGAFTQHLKLHGPQAFRLVTSIRLEEGPYAGHQAILVLPAKPFPLMKLQKELRLIILRTLLAPKSEYQDKIVITSGNGSHGSVNAKAYTDGIKHRLAIMRVNRELASEVRPILYSFHFKFENTLCLLNFLTLAGPEVRNALTFVEVMTYQKHSAHAALCMVGDSKHLQRLHFATGVAVNTTPAKAAKAFYGEAYRFLDMVGCHRGKKDAGLDVLRFGKSAKCFSIKEGDNIRAWDSDEKEEFSELLRAKLK